MATKVKHSDNLPKGPVKRSARKSLPDETTRSSRSRPVIDESPPVLEPETAQAHVKNTTDGSAHTFKIQTAVVEDAESNSDGQDDFEMNNGDDTVDDDEDLPPPMMGGYHVEFFESDNEDEDEQFYGEHAFEDEDDGEQFEDDPSIVVNENRMSKQRMAVGFQQPAARSLDQRKSIPFPDDGVDRSHYKAYIPWQNVFKRAVDDFPHLTECRGCGLELPYFDGLSKTGTVLRRFSPEFFRHCLEECPDYLALGLHKVCDECELVFYDTSAAANHRKGHHKKLLIGGDLQNIDGNLTHVKRRREVSPTVSDESRASTSSSVHYSSSPSVVNSRFPKSSTISSKTFAMTTAKSSSKAKPSSAAQIPRSQYETYYPKYVYIIKSFSAESPCPACGMLLPFYEQKKQKSAEFIKHMAEECEKYASECKSVHS